MKRIAPRHQPLYTEKGPNTLRFKWSQGPFRQRWKPWSQSISAVLLTPKRIKVTCVNRSCFCHNKKEEKTHNYHFFEDLPSFNRETPKLPEKINVTFPLNKLGEGLCLQELVIKYNALLTYLKAHE